MDGADIFLATYEIADEKMREFMRKIAPYMFAADGSPSLTRAQGDQDKDEQDGITSRTS